MRRAAAPFAAALAAYAACAFWLHAEALLSHGTSAVAGGRAGAVFVWEFWWRAEGWRLFGAAGPDAATALFFPAGTVLVPHAPLAVAVGTSLARLMPAVTAHVLLHAAAFVTSGGAMWLLAWRLTSSAPAAFVSGWVFMLSEYALTQQRLGHLGESFAAAIPVAVWGVIELTAGRARRGAVLLGLGLLCAVATTPYLAFAAAVAVIAAGCVRRPSGRDAWTWTVLAFAAAALAAAAIYSPLAQRLPGLSGGSDRYSLAALSFINLPAWHPWSSPMPAAMPENRMGWLGLGAIALAVVGGRRAGAGALAAVAAAGAVLALGPRLTVGSASSGVPLPYALVEALPLVSSMRVPARLMSTAAAGIAALAALGFAAVAPAGRRGWALALAVAALHAAEMLPGWRERPLPVDGGPAYRAMAEDPAPGSLLELPVGIGPEGDLSVNAQAPMLRQTAHHRPLALGRPPRHDVAALRAALSTNLLYELTHPVLIGPLYADPALAGRLANLKSGGPAALASAGVRFAALHRDDPVFPPAMTRDTERLLMDTLGEPWRDEGTVAVWRLP